jgi:ubiquinone/menaquinone biosynthesis C-methylase UbiE
LTETFDRKTASAEIVDLYERHAASYDVDRGRSLFERGWLERFRAEMAPGASVLDIGCGSGEPIARYLIEQGHEVTGVDSAPSLIRICAERFPERTWIVADMRRLDLGARFGGILAWDSFFHLTAEDQRAMFAIFRAHAAPGAALMFTSGPAQGEAIGSYHGEPLYHASLDPQEYRALLDAHGFTVVTHVAEDAACGGHTVWLARQGHQGNTQT